MTNPRGRPKGKPQPHLVKYPGILFHQRLAYTRMRCQARFRDEDFTLTWDEFYSIWEPIWEHRGSKKEHLCLSRIDWDGIWDITNVHIITREQHWKLQKVNKRK